MSEREADGMAGVSDVLDLLNAGHIDEKQALQMIAKIVHEYRHGAGTYKGAGDE